MDPNAGKKKMFNKLNKEEAIQKLDSENFSRKTISFYKYIILKNPNELRDQLYEEWNKLGVLGRVYLAYEGINAQVSIPKNNFRAFKKNIDSYFFCNIPLKIAIEDDGKSFFKLTIKVRKQIVE